MCCPVSQVRDSDARRTSRQHGAEIASYPNSDTYKSTELFRLFRPPLPIEKATESAPQPTGTSQRYASLITLPQKPSSANSPYTTRVEPPPPPQPGLSLPIPRPPPRQTGGARACHLGMMMKVLALTTALFGFAAAQDGAGCADLDGHGRCRRSAPAAHLLQLLGSFDAADADSDLDGNGIIDVVDLLSLLGQFDSSCSRSPPAAMTKTASGTSAASWTAASWTAPRAICTASPARVTGRPSRTTSPTLPRLHGRLRRLPVLRPSVDQRVLLRQHREGPPTPTPTRAPTASARSPTATKTAPSRAVSQTSAITAWATAAGVTLSARAWHRFLRQRGPRHIHLHVSY